MRAQTFNSEQLDCIADVARWLRAHRTARLAQLRFYIDFSLVLMPADQLADDDREFEYWGEEIDA